VPVLNIIPIIVEYAAISTADHFLYAPSIGLLIVLAECCSQGARSLGLSLNARKSLALLVIAISVAATMHQLRFWSSEVLVLERSVRYQPRLGRARMLLGDARRLADDWESAIRDYRAAITIFDDYRQRLAGHPSAEIYRALVLRMSVLTAGLHELRQDTPAALDAYQEALALDADNARLHQRVGVLMMRTVSESSESMASGIRHLLKAVELEPNPVFMLELAIGLRQTGQIPLAIHTLERTLERFPEFTPARDALEDIRDR
jgi:tetratricopeptide (TPR) repeat protein